MNHHEPQPVPPVDRLDVSLIDHEVVVIGPGSVAFSMTIEAARETYRRLGEVLAGET